MQLVLLRIKARQAHAVKVQEVLTKHGCDIMLRLGLHEVSDAACADDGLVILQVKPEQSVVNSLVSDLQAVVGVEVKSISM
ncbi:MAG: hypothetical protein AB1439_05330 [candidate division FCPU426 bacterium]